MGIEKENGRNRIKFVEPVEIEFYDYLENNIKTSKDCKNILHISNWLNNSGYEIGTSNKCKLLKVYASFVKCNFKELLS